MKVLHVIPFVSELYGGPSRAIFELCRSQASSGLSPVIATTCATNEPDFGECANQVKVINGVTTHFFSGALGTYRFSNSLGHWLSANIRNYDIVHIHSIFTHTTLLASGICRRRGVPYIIRTQGILYPWCLAEIGKFKKLLYLNLFELNNLKKAARIHFTTEHERDGCAYSELRRRSYVLPLGIDPVKRRCGRDILDSAFPVLFKKKLLACVSRVHPIKGFRELLPAIAATLKRNSDWTFVIAGTGRKDHVEEVRSAVASLGLESNVFMAGHVSGSLKEALLQNADAFVLSSYSENFGIAIVEAMQQGLPVAISDRIALKDEVIKNNAGIVFSLTPASISQAINALIDSADLRAELGANGKRLVAMNYSWEHVTRRQIQIYEEIISERGQ